MVATADDATLEELVLQWRPFIRRLASRIASAVPGHSIEDAEQELAALALESRSFDPARGGFGTWLELLARQLYWRLIRDRRRGGPLARVCSLSLPAHDDAPGEIAATVADRNPADVIDLVVSREQEHAVRAAVASLPRHQREAINRQFFAVPDDSTGTRADRADFLDALASLRDHLGDDPRGD